MPVERFEYFYEWDGLAENWITSEDSFDNDFPSQPPDTGESVATWIIEDIFGLDLYWPDRVYGSYLPGYDIKSRDAYSMVQLSLSAELKDELQMECYADEEGTVHFYKIGKNTSNIGFDVLYSIDTGTLSKPCDNCLVIGYDPPPKRYAGREFDVLTYANNIPSQYYFDDDDDQGDYPLYHIWGDILGPEQCPYYREGYIEYGNMHFDQEGALQAEGVYDRDKYETVSSYIYKVEVPFFKQGSTRIEFSNTTPRFVELESMGKLQKRNWTTRDFYISDYCKQGQKPDYDAGVKLERSNDKRFLGVKDVYIYGYKLNRITLDYGMSGDKRVKGPATFLVDIDTKLSEPFQLSKGQDYLIVKETTGDYEVVGEGEEAVVQEQETDYYKIVFSCNVHPLYVDNFGGNVLFPTETTIRISPSSIYTREGEGDAANLRPASFGDLYDWTKRVEGVLRDGITEVTNTEDSMETVAIFPLGEGQSGYAVKKIIVVYEWDNPCIAVFDEENNVTLDNLENINFSFYPIINQDRPAPVAINGKALDPTEILPDYDATTIQDLASTEYARAFSSLESGDIKVTLPFLYTDEDCERVSTYIKELQNEVVETTTYICSPEAEPVLGEVIDGKTINSIDYSYQDSSQYLISVQAGPIWQGLSGWDTVVYQNKTERLQLEGIVTDVYEDNYKCQVKLEQLGAMECINNSKQILEKGDRVSITVFNNPVAK